MNLGCYGCVPLAPSCRLSGAHTAAVLAAIERAQRPPAPRSIWARRPSKPKLTFRHDAAQNGLQRFNSRNHLVWVPPHFGRRLFSPGAIRCSSKANMHRSPRIWLTAYRHLKTKPLSKRSNLLHVTAAVGCAFHAIRSIVFVPRGVVLSSQV